MSQALTFFLRRPGWFAPHYCKSRGRYQNAKNRRDDRDAARPRTFRFVLPPPPETDLLDRLRDVVVPVCPVLATVPRRPIRDWRHGGQLWRSSVASFFIGSSPQQQLQWLRAPPGPSLVFRRRDSGAAVTGHDVALSSLIQGPLLMRSHFHVSAQSSPRPHRYSMARG